MREQRTLFTRCVYSKLSENLLHHILVYTIHILYTYVYNRHIILLYKYAEITYIYEDNNRCTSLPLHYILYDIFLNNAWILQIIIIVWYTTHHTYSTYMSKRILDINRIYNHILLYTIYHNANDYGAYALNARGIATHCQVFAKIIHITKIYSYTYVRVWDWNACIRI